MTEARLLVVEDGIPASSRKCYSCQHYESSKEIEGLEKFCSGQVVKLRVEDRAFCGKKGKDVGYKDKCSHWKLDKKIKSFLKL